MMPPPPPQVTYIPADRIHPNRPDKSGDDQLRGMAETIKYFGVLVPLWIAPHPSRPGHYMIKDGHRRYRAGQLAGIAQYPCTSRRPTPAEQRIRSSVLAEVVLNTHRAAWGPVEFALKLGRLRDGGLTQADIARYTGLSDQTISYHLELLELDESTLNRIRRGELPAAAGHEAVRAARAAGPPPPRGPGVTEIKPRRTGFAERKPHRKPPAHFTATHRLAGDARSRCEKARHEAWTRLGKVACGECWEVAIAADALAGGARPGPAAAGQIPFRAAG